MATAVGQADAFVDSNVAPVLEESETAPVANEPAKSSPAVSLSLPPRPERPDPLSPAAIGVSATLASIVLLSSLLIRQRD